MDYFLKIKKIDKYRHQKMLLDQYISLSRLLESRIILLDMLLSNKILCATYYYIKVLLDTCIMPV